MSAETHFVLALERLDGVGRVTVNRLLEAFRTYDTLLHYPREQVLARLKGVRHAADLVNRLLDEAVMRKHLDNAAQHEAQLATKKVHLLTRYHASWPQGLGDLEHKHAPTLLYAYGTTAPLTQPLVAFFARPPLPGPCFEHAQALVRRLLPASIVPITNLASGFDVVVHKIASMTEPLHPSVGITHTGMAKLATKMRPVVGGLVRSGGTFLSPFPMQHGPFDHDDKERARTQAALAHACVFVEPQPKTAEWVALEWALSHDRPVFAVASPDVALPNAVHRLTDTVDFDWVIASAKAHLA